MIYRLIDDETEQIVELELDDAIFDANWKDHRFTWQGRVYRLKSFRISTVRSVDKVGPVKHKSSEALACHPSQVGLANEHWSKIDSGIHYAKDGTVHYSSRGARARHIKLSGLVDRNGGYGDG